MNKRVLILAGWVFVQVFLGGMADQGFSQTAPARVVVREFTQVEGDQIFLGQIASIHAKPFIREILAAIDLGKSPKPGKIRTLNKNRVASQLRSCPAAPGDIQLESPDKIYIRQAYQEVTNQDLHNRVDNILSAYFAGREYALKRIQIQNTKFYPKGDLKMVPDSPIEVDKKGGVNFTLNILVNRKKVDEVRVRGQVAVYEKIVCAAKNIEKGRPISPDDIILVKTDIFSVRGDIVRDTGVMAGQQLKVTVRKNDPVRMDWLIPLPLIQKGAVVTLVAMANHMRIVTSGIAREDGFKDKILRIENLKSGKVVRGIARDGATVEVIY